MASLNKVLPATVKAALEAAVVRFASQARVAEELGVSTAVVSQLLRDRYAGDVSGMETRIRGQFMAETLQCPVMGVLGRRTCLDYQANPMFTNPIRAALASACPKCPNRKDAR